MSFPKLSWECFGWILPMSNMNMLKLEMFHDHWDLCQTMSYWHVRQIYHPRIGWRKQNTGTPGITGQKWSYACIFNKPIQYLSGRHDFKNCFVHYFMLPCPNDTRPWKLDKVKNARVYVSLEDATPPSWWVFGRKVTPLGPKVDAPEDLGFHEFAYVFLVGMGRNHQRLCCSVFLFLMHILLVLRIFWICLGVMLFLVVFENILEKPMMFKRVRLRVNQEPYI